MLTHSMAPADITTELAAGEDAWRTYPEPFGVSHPDPCATPLNSTTGESPARRQDQG